MSRRTIVYLVLFAVGAVSTIGISSIAAASGGTTEHARGSYQVTNQGKALRLTKRAAARLPRSREVTAVSLLGIRGDHAFYRVEMARFGNCYAVGGAAAPGLVDSIKCVDSSAALIDFSIVETSRAYPGEARLIRVAGVAAEGVDMVGVVGVSGEIIARATVTRNLYSIPSPPSRAAGGIVALDSSGDVLWRPGEAS